MKLGNSATAACTAGARGNVAAWPVTVSVEGELSLLDDEIAKSSSLLDDMHRVQSEDDSGDRAASASRRTFIDSLGEHIGRASRSRRRVAGRTRRAGHSGRGLTPRFRLPRYEVSTRNSSPLWVVVDCWAMG